MTSTRLASGFWVSAKLRQLQNAGCHASILAKGNDQAGAITLVLRARDGTLRLAVPAMNLDSNERQFEWYEGVLNDAELSAYMTRQLRFDRDQWFVECECNGEQFGKIFDLGRPASR